MSTSWFAQDGVKTTTSNKQLEDIRNYYFVGAKKV